MIIDTFKAVDNNLEFYEIVFSKEDIPNLNTKFENVIKNHIRSGMPNDKTGQRSGEGKFYVDYLTVGLVGRV